jgi:hypothetical protein
MLYSTVLFISIIGILYIVSLIKRDYIYDLSISRKFNYLDIHDIDHFIRNIPECPNNINIDTYLPKSVSIKIFPEKGWGIVANKDFKKDDIIYICPISRYPGTITIISKEHGTKKIDKDIHMGDMAKKFDLFCYYDSLLNHSYNSNSYHDIQLFTHKNQLFTILIASTTIDKGDEITINYLELIEAVYLLKSYLQAIFKGH